MRILLNTLYVTTPEAYLSKDGLNVVVSVKQNEIFRIPIHNIEQIITFGYMGASPGLMKLCADNNVSLTFLSPQGRYISRSQGPTRGQGLYMLATILKGDLAISTTIAIIDTFTQLSKLARTIDKVNEDAKEHGILPDKATEGKIQAAMNEVFADKLPLKMRRLTFGVNLGVLKFSIETTRESKK